MHQKTRRQLGKRSKTEIRAGEGGEGGRGGAGGGAGGGGGGGRGGGGRDSEDEDNAYADVDGDIEEEEDCRAFRSLRFRQRYSREGSACVLPFRFKGTNFTTSTLLLLSRLV